MSNIDNPFIVYGYNGPEYFCDRKEETEEIISALNNGCNMTIMSPRRYGKTGLIRNAFHFINQEEPEKRCFYIDIYATSCLSDFIQALGKAILGKLDSPLQKAENLITKIIKSAQITMSPNIDTGIPEYGLSFMPQDATTTLEEIFNYIRQSEYTCYIAIDEFQQIQEYKDNNVEALLRTHIQQTNNARFIFSGSKLHMMSEMFNSPKHPFYRSTEKLHISVLDEEVYYEFVKEKMQKKGTTLSKDIFHKIYERVDGVTWYIQMIMNRLYRLEPCEITMDIVQQTIVKIIRSEEDDYKRMLHGLTANQSSLLRAIASEGIVSEPMGGKFLRSHNLKSSSSIQRSLKFLTDEEYIYKSDAGYIVYDRFFGTWLRTL